MAVEGFSIFLGSISIFIHLITFFYLITFKKHRSNKATYFDAMMCGSMVVYLSLYYMALNYPEGEPAKEEEKGDRNLLACIIIILPMLGFLIAALSFMCAASFWLYVNTTFPSKSAGKARKRLGPVLYPTSDRYDNEDRTVTFGEVKDNSAERETFLRQTSNKIMIATTVATVGLPILYILINIFMSDDTKADIIHTDHKCWVGGHKGELMWTLIFTPSILSIVAAAAFYLWCGIKIDRSAFMSAKPEDPTLRNLQLRVILVTGLGLWWLIEIPALAKSSPSAIQHVNGIINIPLAVLALYTFVTQRPEIRESWDKHVPIAQRAKKELGLCWKYYIYRPIIQKVFKYKNKKKKGSSSDSTPTNPPAALEENAPPTLEIPAEEPPRAAQYYSTEESMAGEYVEFGEPNQYVNEVALEEGEPGHPPDYDMPTLPDPHEDMPRYELEDQQGYDNRQEESPLYIDPPEEDANDYTFTRL